MFLPSGALEGDSRRRRAGGHMYREMDSCWHGSDCGHGLISFLDVGSRTQSVLTTSPVTLMGPYLILTDIEVALRPLGNVRRHHEGTATNTACGPDLTESH